jgi:hypothetical protein
LHPGEQLHQIRIILSIAAACSVGRFRTWKDSKTESLG